MQGNTFYITIILPLLNTFSNILKLSLIRGAYSSTPLYIQKTK